MKKKIEKKKELMVKDVLNQFMDRQFPRLGRKITEEEYDVFRRLTYLPEESRHLVLSTIEAWNEASHNEAISGWDE